MDASKFSKLAMFNSVAALLSDSTAIIATIPALPAALTEFQAQVNAISALAGTQSLPVAGAVADKDTALQAMAEAALAVANGVKVYASQHKLGDLRAKVDVAPSDFELGRAQDRVTTAQQVHDAAAGIVAALADFGVTAADVTDLGEKIAAGQAAINAPRAVVGAKRSATQQLPEAFHQADQILQDQLDPLAAKLAKTQPDFYAKYQAARVIVDRPGGHASPVPPVATPAPAAEPAH